MTAQTLINRAFRLINSAGGSGEAATADESNDALDWLNSMIDAWALKELTKYFLRRTTQTLTSGTASYTIGTDGTINIIRPTELRFAGLILDTGATTLVERPIDVMTDERYAAWPQKTLQTTYVTGIWYDRNWSAGLGTIYVLPIPDVGTTRLVLYTPVAIAEFADLSTDYTFPPAYEEAIEYNLAKRLAIPFGRALPPSVDEIAKGSLALIERSNVQLREVTVDPTMPRARGGTMPQSVFDGGTF